MTDLLLYLSLFKYKSKLFYNPGLQISAWPPAANPPPTVSLSKMSAQHPSMERLRSRRPYRSCFAHSQWIPEFDQGIAHC